MIQSKATRLLAGTLAALMLALPGGISSTASSTDSGTGGGYETPSLADLLSTVSYEEYLAKNQNVPAGTGSAVLSGDTIASYNEAITNAPGVTAVEFNGEKALYLPSEGIVGWNITVPAAGKYVVKFTYAAVDNSDSKTTSIERTFYINETVPFYESRFLTMTKSWLDETESFQHWEGKPLYKYIKDGKNVYRFVDEDGNVYKQSIGKEGQYKDKMIFIKDGKVDAEKIKGAARYPVYSTDINGNEIKSDKELLTVGNATINGEDMGIGEKRDYLASDSTGYYIDPLQFVFK